MRIAAGALKSGSALSASAALEIALPFARMLLLTRALSLSELGFASALATAYAVYDQITDVAAHRCVYAQKRENFAAALAGAHGLLALRGLLLAALALALARPAAALFGFFDGAGDFAALAGALLIRGFEHLAPKVAERDSRYGPQLRVALGGAALSLLALVASLALGWAHNALTASLYGLALGQTLASHAVAATPYRLAFGGFFAQALRFGAPLMANGLGLAIAAQGDRLLVGALLGAEALGFYAVAMLAVMTPVSLVQRMMGALAGAALYNSGGDRDAKIRRIARAAPAIGAVYACAALAFANFLAGWLFGPRFVLPPLGLALLCAAALLRIARAEPFTSLLLLDGRTKQAALGNLSALAALGMSTALMLAYQNVEAALFGRALGEAIALLATFALTRPLLGPASGAFFRALALACGLTLVASLSMFGALTAFFCATLAGVAAALIALRGAAPIRAEAAP